MILNAIVITDYMSLGCRQVQVVQMYTAEDADELTLKTGDVLKVYRESEGKRCLYDLSKMYDLI